MTAARPVQTTNTNTKKENPMNFHIINIDDEQLAPTADFPEAAARLADMIHAAVDGLSELSADADPDEVLAAFTAWTHARIGLAEGRILLLLNERGVPITSLVKVTGISDYGVRDRITWARIERSRAASGGVGVGPRYLWNKDGEPL